jgi:hemolysin activation/secretion protein
MRARALAVAAVLLLAPTAAPGQSAAPPADAPPLAAAQGFVLRGLRLTSDRMLDQAALDRIAGPFLGRVVGVEEVEEIRQQVSLAMVERGYLNSGAVVPDQTVTDGVLTLQAIEGRITGIELSGAHWFRESYIRGRLRRGLGIPFRVQDLELQQRLLLNDPLLRQLNLDIQPGLAPGEARLFGQVTEAWPFALTAQVANNQSPTLGGVRGQLQGAIGNLLGVGDVLVLQYGQSAGLDDGAVAYSVPIASDDTRLNLRFDINGAVVVSQVARDLGIESRFDSVAVGLSRPFWRTPEHRLLLGASAEWRRARTFLLGEPFSFVEGASAGHTNVTVLRAYQDWLDQTADHVVALRSTFSLGVKALGATVTAERPTGRFFVWLGQGQYVQRLFGDWEFVLRGALQLTPNPLFPIEQFVFGGLGTVRGYREYLTATDNALNASLELRIPVARLPLPWTAAESSAGLLQLVPFFDRGAGWNTGRPTPPFSHLTSVGVGLRWLVAERTAAEIYYGYGLKPVHLDNTLQDQGIHFRIVAGLL